MADDQTAIPLAQDLLEEALASHAVEIVGATEDGRVLYERPVAGARETGVQ